MVGESATSAAAATPAQRAKRSPMRATITIVMASHSTPMVRAAITSGVGSAS